MSLYDDLQSVQGEAQQNHVYVSDQDKHGIFEHWEVSLEGDCEDYALWCRKQLKERFDIDADLIFCKTENDVGHLVCSVDGWILDNRHEWVMSNEDLNYTWLKIGKPDGTWYEIE